MKPPASRKEYEEVITATAAEFVRRAIRNTAKNREGLWYGVNFEGELPSLAALL